MKTLVNTAKTLVNEKRLKLTPREREILELIATGAAQKEIAAHLDISRFTVDVHVKNIKLKTGLQKATELTALYFANSYHIPLCTLPQKLRKLMAAAMLVLSLFSIAIQTTEIVRVFRSAPARRVARRTSTRRGRKNTDFEYLPLTA